jgi:hypothetical protein
LLDVTVSDNCGIPALEPISFDSEGPCPTVITWVFRATDACGNTATCAYVITVDDVTPPTIECPDNLTFECIEDVPEPSTDGIFADDNCDAMLVVTFERSTTTGSCPTIIKRVYRAIDACENSVSCTQTITVHDMTDPTLICPDDITIELAEDVDVETAFELADEQCMIWMDGFIADDNCDAPFMTFIEIEIVLNCEDGPEEFTPYTKIVRYRVEDECGNSTSCTRRFTVEDSTPPEISCPPDVVIECDESTHPDHTGHATATDSGDSDPTITWSDMTDQGPEGECSYHTYRITRTWYAEDNCGNINSCTQYIDVEDTTPPSLTTCDPDNLDLTYECNSDLTNEETADAWDAANQLYLSQCASDLCGDVHVSIDNYVEDLSNDGGCTGSMTVTYTVSEDCE